ncbi:MAG: ABC transporter substrate-binding protein [Turicibacter sp.]|nr:ABC transporter substrate-binding protein [Turicibacter sp.]
MAKTIKSGVVLSWLFILGLAVAVVITSPNVEQRQEDEIVRIGILQLSNHGALEEARLGIMSRLEERGYIDGENIEIILFNAQSDQSNLQLMSQQLISEGSDVLIGISTPATLALANETSEVPILATAITSLSAANLVESYERPGGNVSGTSSMAPVATQLELLVELTPGIQTVGFIYNASEANSAVKIEIAEEEAARLGLETVHVTVTNTNDVAQAFQSLIGRVDGVWIPADNTIASAMPTVGAIAMENDLPVVNASTTAARAGGLATIGIDHYQLGRQVADMALDVIFNGADVAEMPVDLQFETYLFINEEFLAGSNVTIPQSLRDRLED